MRIQGTEGVALIECINPEKDKWRVRWDVQSNTGIDEQGILRTGVNYEEIEFLHRPVIGEVKAAVLNRYNEQINQAILSGFTWKELPVWLSSENQFNYKAAYDLAIQTGGKSLPVVFKFGTEETPVYHEFVDVADLTDFYVASAAYIQATLAQGWEVKDGIDWSPYL